METKKINPIAEQSKDMIISALLKLLETKHYSKITISDIACQAQLARRTFYRNFTSKEDIIRAYYMKQGESFIEFLKKEEEVSVYMIAKAYFTFMNKNLNVLKLLEKNDLLHLILQFTQPLIYQTFDKQKCLNHNNNSFEYFFAFTSGGLWNILVSWLKEGAVKTPDEMAAFISTIVNKDLYTFS